MPTEKFDNLMEAQKYAQEIVSNGSPSLGPHEDLILGIIGCLTAIVFFYFWLKGRKRYRKVHRIIDKL